MVRLLPDRPIGPVVGSLLEHPGCASRDPPWRRTFGDRLSDGAGRGRPPHSRWGSQPRTKVTEGTAVRGSRSRCRGAAGSASHGGWSRCCDYCTGPRWGLPQPRGPSCARPRARGGLAGQLPDCTGVHRYRPRHGSTRVAARRGRDLTKMGRRTRSVSPWWGPYVALAKATGIRLTAVLRQRGEHLRAAIRGSCSRLHRKKGADQVAAASMIFSSPSLTALTTAS